MVKEQVEKRLFCAGFTTPSYLKFFLLYFKFYYFQRELFVKY